MQLYRRAASMQPDWATPLFRFGETALSTGLYEEALAAYDRAALKILGSAANLNVRARTRGAYLRGALDCFARSLPSASCF